MTICPKCGSQLSDNAAFCTNCGTPISAPAQPADDSQAVPPQGFQGDPFQQGFQNQSVEGFQNEPQGFQNGPQNFQDGPQGFQNGPQNFQGGPIPPQPPVPPVPPQPAPNDHTADFEASDISDNKIIAMAAYLLGSIGVVIALLAAKDSPYANFHSRQALKLQITEVLIGFLTVALCWTLIIPIAGLICLVIVFVVRIICFFQVASGKAKDAPIVGSFPFFR